MRACGVALLLATGALPHWAALSTLRPELPPELPLPSVPAAPAVLSWLRSATVVQIQGCELNLLVQNTSAAAAWRALGFDTVVFDPPGMHNVYFPQQAAVSEAEFEQVLGHFKAAGFKILFYTSLTNLGHSPLWQNGTLAREHPEWAMRDAAGAPQHSFKPRVRHFPFHPKKQSFVSRQATPSTSMGTRGCLRVPTLL